MFFKKLILFGLLYSVNLISFSCDTGEPIYCKMIKNIKNDFSNEMKKKYNLLPKTSGGSFLYDVEYVALGYNSYHQCQIEELRPIIVDAVDTLLFKINNSNEIKPYLHKYPFEHVCLIISFMDEKDHIYVDKPYIAYVQYGHGEITYSVSRYTRDPTGFKVPLLTTDEVLTETLEEAKAILAQK